MGTCFLVLGPPRSGTSVVSGILHRLGVVMGWELKSEDGKPRYDWPTSHAMNPKGFYQDAPIENNHVAMWGQRVPNVGERPTAFIVEFQSLITARAGRGHPAWGLKSSFVAWLIPEIIAVCSDELRLVVTSRQPAQSKASWRRYFPDDPATEARVDNVTAQIAVAMADHPTVPRHTIAFDNLFDQTDDVLAALAAFVGRPLNADALAFVDPSLRRVF